MKKPLATFLILSAIAIAENKNYCHSINQQFYSYVKTAEVAHEIGDLESRENQFREAKRLFYESLRGDCGQYTDEPKMKRTMIAKLKKFQPQKQ